MGTSMVIYWDSVANLRPQTCFTNSTEVLFAVLTFYQLRVIERLWGSRKFAVSIDYRQCTV